jgi:hypothetical protein
MGIRVRKSFKVAPGVRVNMGKKSSSVSLGNKYVHTTVSTSGSKRSGGHMSEDVARMLREGGNVSEKKRKSDRMFLKVCGIIMYIVAAFALLMTIAGFSTDTFLGIVLLIPTVIAFLFGHLLISMSKH